MRVHASKGFVVGLIVIGIGVALDAQRQRASPRDKEAERSTARRSPSTTAGPT